MSKRKAPNDKKLKELYLDKKLSSGDIAKKYKMSRVCICRHINRLGITRPESGENSRNRKYNVKVYRSGYPVTFKPNHPRRNNLGYVFDHILEWEEATGYIPSKIEQIHHIDIDRLNHKIKNLYLCKTNSQHQKLHASLNKIITTLVRNGTIKFKNGKYYL
jgi:hypothetical protein